MWFMLALLKISFHGELFPFTSKADLQEQVICSPNIAKYYTKPLKASNFCVNKIHYMTNIAFFCLCDISSVCFYSKCMNLLCLSWNLSLYLSETLSTALRRL